MDKPWYFMWDMEHQKVNIEIRSWKEKGKWAVNWTQISIPPLQVRGALSGGWGGMLMSVGVESSHWQIAKRLRSWASSEARPCQQSCRDGLRMSALQFHPQNPWIYGNAAPIQILSCGILLMRRKSAGSPNGVSWRIFSCRKRRSSSCR